MNHFFEGIGVAIAILLIIIVPIFASTYIGKIIDNTFNLDSGTGTMATMIIYFCLFIGATNYILNKDK